jgi:hypothetical protein
LGNFRRRELEEALPPLRTRAKQSAFNEFAEVSARSLRRGASSMGKVRCAKLAAVE